MMILIAQFVLSTIYPQLWASTFEDKAFETRVNEAPNVVYGSVSRVEVRRSKEDGRIYTYSEFDVKEPIKGTISSARVEIKTLGGRLETEGLIVPGSAKLSEGDEVVLFLGTQNSDGTHSVHNMMMGRYGFSYNSKGEKILSGPGLHSEKDTVPKEITLENLRKIVQTQKSNGTGHETQIAKKDAVIPDKPKSHFDEGNAEKRQEIDTDSTETNSNKSTWIWAIVIIGLLIWLIRRRKK